MILPLGDRLDHPGVDGDREVEAKLTLAEVRRAVAQLPTEQREALLLVCVEGLPNREVAEMLNLPVGTVTSRVFRARIALARVLEGKTSPSAQIVRIRP